MRSFNEILGKIEEKLAPPRISKFIEWLKNDDDKSDPKETDPKHEKGEKAESGVGKELIIDGVKLQPISASLAMGKEQEKESADKEPILPLIVEPKTPSPNGSKPGQNPKEPAPVPVKK